jgi:hypothetical protein
MYRPIARYASFVCWLYPSVLSDAIAARAYSAAIVRGMTDEPAEKPSKRDERLVIPLDPEVAVRALLEVDPATLADDEADDQPRVGER